MNVKLPSISPFQQNPFEVKQNPSSFAYYIDAANNGVFTKVSDKVVHNENEGADIWEGTWDKSTKKTSFASSPRSHSSITHIIIDADFDGKADEHEFVKVSTGRETDIQGFLIAKASNIPYSEKSYKKDINGDGVEEIITRHGAKHDGVTMEDLFYGTLLLYYYDRHGISLGDMPDDEVFVIYTGQKVDLPNKP